MKPQLVTGTPFYADCVECRSRHLTGDGRPSADRMYADLDGEPFKAYYCRNCVYVIRYVVTKTDPEHTRTLFDAAQGQFTYATPEEAQARADTFKQNSPDHPGIETLEVRPCKCWPVHFDPKGVFFDGPHNTSNEGGSGDD